MRLGSCFAVLILAAATAAAQRSPSPTGFGRIMFPGGPNPGQIGAAPGTGSLLYPGGTRPVTGGVFVQPPQINHQQHPNQPVNPRGGTGALIAPYPVFYGANYYMYGVPAAGLAPSIYRSAQPSVFSNSSLGNYTAAPTELYPPSDGNPPVVIINQYFQSSPDGTVQPSRASQVDAQPAAQAVSNDPELPTTFLIGLKDRSVLAASAYWIEDDILNYITPRGSENQISLALVDRDFSRQLNRDRSVSFGMPER